MNIQLLDCTLRDGGYINEWNFGKECILSTARMLQEASVDLIELGFLDETKAEYSDDLSVFPNIASAEKMAASGKTNYVLMIMHGKYDIEHIPPYEGGAVKGIRYCFKKAYMNRAAEICESILKKGYNLYLQPASLSDYSDRELLELIEKSNGLNLSAFYIVDTYGVMRKKDVVRFFYIIDNNLRKEIPIGFHSHNNLQLSFSNAQALIEINQNRPLFVDSSVFGMGRGAGNLCTELIAQYINENISKKYEMLPILEIMDDFIMPIYMEKPWGYAAPYYLAAINNCHPNYATFLMNKQTLCIRDIAAIMKTIPKDKLREYDEKLIAGLYLDFQRHNVDDSELRQELRGRCADRKVLVLAPGRSLAAYKEKIASFIADESPLVFAINHIPESFRYDYVFISNLKRFSGLGDAVSKLGDKLLCTSNISAKQALNYSSYLNEEEAISDNAGLMLINVLRKIGVRELYLAGFDGFKTAERENYFDNRMNLNVKDQRRKEITLATIEYFRKLKQSLKVTFLTPTVYNPGETS